MTSFQNMLETALMPVFKKEMFHEGIIGTLPLKYIRLFVNIVWEDIV